MGDGHASALGSPERLTVSCLLLHLLHPLLLRSGSLLPPRALTLSSVCCDEPDSAPLVPTMDKVEKAVYNCVIKSFEELSLIEDESERNKVS